MMKKNVYDHMQLQKSHSCNDFVHRAYSVIPTTGHAWTTSSLFCTPSMITGVGIGQKDAQNDRG